MDLSVFPELYVQKCNFQEVELYIDLLGWIYG